MSVLDKLGFALLVMLIGMLIVFFGLIILICLIKIMSFIIGAFSGKKKSAAPAPAPAAPVVVPEPVAEAAADADANADELIAVITAALMAYNKDSNKTLVVRSIRRAAAKTPAWAKAGRADQLASRF